MISPDRLSMHPDRLSPLDRQFRPEIDWLFHASRLRRVGDRIGYRECLRLARVMRLAGRVGCRPR